MKNIILFISIFVINNYTFAQGISWEKDFQTAVNKSKTTGKPIFVECYLTGCPICQSFEPIFKDPKVAAFYNKNFVNYKLNGEKPDQKKILDDLKLWLPSFPNLLFFDANKKLLHQSEAGNPVADGLINIGKIALDPNLRSENYENRYLASDRDLYFLFQYASYARIVQDTVLNIKLANDEYAVFPKEALNSKESWAITRKTVTDVDNGFFQYWINNLDLAKKHEEVVAHGHGGELETVSRIIITSLNSSRGLQYNSAQIEKIKEYMTKSGSAKYIDSNTWQFEARANLREGQPEKAIILLNKMAKIYEKSGASLVYLASFMIDNWQDKNYISSAETFLKQAKPLLTSTKEKAEYYFQLARLNKEMNQLKEAKVNLLEGKKMAMANNLNLKKYNDLESELMK